MATRAETETKPDALRREYAAWSKAQGLSFWHCGRAYI